MVHNASEVSSGFKAYSSFEESLILLPETYNNDNNDNNRLWIIQIYYFYSSGSLPTIMFAFPELRPNWFSIYIGRNTSAPVPNMLSMEMDNREGNERGIFEQDLRVYNPML